MKVENTRVSRIAVSACICPTEKLGKTRCWNLMLRQKVVRFYPLEQEIAFTEWRGGRLFLAAKSSGNMLDHCWQGVSHPLQLIIM